MRFLLPSLEGIEDVVAADALDLGATAAAPLRGRVLVEADPDFVYRANLAHPTASRVQLVLHEGPVAELADVARLVDEVAWEDVFDLSLSFAADCVRTGEHAFTSLDVKRATGDAIIRRFQAAHGERPRVDLHEPDVVAHVYVADDHAYVAVDTTGEALHKRSYRVYQHPAPVVPTLASALVRLSGWKRGLLFDPLCGSGTIPIEADYRGRGRAVNLARAEWAFRKLRLHDAERFEDARFDLACSMEDEAPPVWGNERNPKHADGARANAEAAGASRALRFTCEDFNRLPRPEGLAAVVTNPPWGLRLSGRKVSDRIGAELRAKLREWAEGGAFSAVVLMGNHRFEKEEPRPAEARDVLYGGAACRMLRYEL